MNIHLFHDDKFTNGAIAQFEKYYPNQNKCIVLLYDSESLKFTTSNDKITVFHIRDKNIVRNIGQIISDNRAQNLFVHYMDSYKASISLKILAKHNLKFYWIFYGGDLYDYLTRYHQYDILENKSMAKPNLKKDFVKNMKYLLWFGWTTKTALKRAFSRLDYFCFWNEYDFKLFHDHIESKALYKDFIYYNALGNPNYPSAQKKNTIMINHSASPSGNHHFVIDILKNINLESNAFEVLLPLSYGDRAFADHIVTYAQRQLSGNISALRDFMPLTEYQAQLSEVKIAIFGMKRQEAAGNIFQLINMGAKVFLRQENTLFSWLKKRNFIVFSIENDSNELKHLNELSSEQIQHNKNCYAATFNEEAYTQMMEKLID